MHCLLCYTKYKIFSITRCLKNNSFHPHTFYLKLWYKFEGNSSYCNKAFVLQNKIIRSITNTRTVDSRRELFKDIKYCQCIHTTFCGWHRFYLSNFNQRTMNKDIDLILEIAQKWFESNMMLLNYNKTSFMQFSSNIYDQSPDNIQVGNHRISLRNSIKFLGITIESSTNLENTY